MILITLWAVINEVKNNIYLLVTNGLKNIYQVVGYNRLFELWLDYYIGRSYTYNNQSI